MEETGLRIRRHALGWLPLGILALLGTVPREAAGSSFYTVTPCRIVDTRNTAGPLGGPAIGPGQVRALAVGGRCGISSSAEAVAANITVVTPAANGHLTIVPTGSPQPSTSTINFRAGLVRANNSILRLGTAGGLTVFSGSPGDVHVIVDVNGFFADPALESSTVARPAFNPPPGSYTGEQTVDLTTSTPGAQIRYTTDGSTPTRTHGTIYSGPLMLSGDTDLRAMAWKDGLTDSGVTQGAYDITLQETLFLATLTPQSGAVTLGAGRASLLLAADEQTADLHASWSNLSGPLTSSHIHAPDGQIIFDIDTAPTGPDGSWTWTIVSAGTWTRAQILAALRAGQCYLNLHTADYPSGEIKGFFRLSTGSSTFTPPPPPPPLPSGPPSAADAARFLVQASFGPTPQTIATVQSMGYASWIEDQFTKPIVSHLSYVDALPGTDLPSENARESVWKQAIQGPDQLRQRVAWALSEIFVVSDRDDDLHGVEATAAYMDILARDAFGNVRQLLEDVTLSPAMGSYLDMLSNDKEDPDTGQNPNENYAREILQLFSIGLYKVHPDGSLQLSVRGLPIDTYDQETVEGFAQVFTGWTFAGQNHAQDWRFYWPEPDWRNPMQVWPEHHSTGTKRLLDGVTLPASQTPQADLTAAHDNIFQHPNIGPFLCRQLIQRLVTSNPSPAYVYRCGQAFANNGQGARGDMKAVIRAILLDWEARSTDLLTQPGYGKVREPMIRFVALLRALNAQPPGDGRFRYYWQSSAEWGLNQSPLQAPTVFNFFEPTYAQPGPIADAGLVAPELHIINETSVFGTANFLHAVLFDGYADDQTNIYLDYSYFTTAGSDATLLDRVSLVFYAGRMAPETRTIFAEALADPDFPTHPFERAQTLIWLVSLSPEFAVQR